VKTEFLVEGGKAVTQTAWMAKLTALGFTCELDPSFDIFGMQGFVRVRFARPAQRAIDAGFDFCIATPAPDVEPGQLTKVLERAKQRAANIAASNLAASFKEASKKISAAKIRELRDPKREQHLIFRVEAKNSRPGDYAAAAMCSAAYAAASGGRLTDRYGGGHHWIGAAALAGMANSKWLAMPGKDVPFTSWDAVEPTAKSKQPSKPAANKPAAKKPAANKPAAKKPAAKKPAKKPAAKKPAKKVARR